MSDCWRMEISSRISFKEVVPRLEKLHAELLAEERAKGGKKLKYLDEFHGGQEVRC